MNRAYRITLCILFVFVIGGMAIFNTVRKNNLDYQEHPIASVIGSIIPSLLVAGCLYWFIGWNSRRMHNNKDDKFYEEVAREMQEKPLVAGLWTKAFTEAGGDDAKTRALYIKYRVAELVKAHHEQLEKGKEKARTSTHRPNYKARASFCILLTSIFAVSGLAIFTEDNFWTGLVCWVIAFFCGLATKYCLKETH